MRCLPMPDTLEETWEFFAQFIGVSTVAVIEKVTGYVGNRGDPGSRMFTFGANHGALKAFMTAACIEYTEVPTVTWLAGMMLGNSKKRGLDKKQWKQFLQETAQAMHPDVKITLKTADAVLIAEYCHRYSRVESCR